MNYELIDTGEGRRLEKFGDYILDRPDPQIIWSKNLPSSDWEKADARYERISEDKGKWIINTKLPEKWEMEHQGIKFWARLTPFKHTGVFPEQAEQWEFLERQINQSINQPINVLNLFAYTGIATLFAAKAGAKVTHVDASKPGTAYANENKMLNKLDKAPIRWIVDDALKFTAREIKRGVKYDVILMDPPAYGHGPNGEVWDFNKDFPKLLENCKQLLSDTPLFVLANAYAISSSSITLANTLQGYFGKLRGSVENGELTLKEKSAGRLLSTGIWARWSS